MSGFGYPFGVGGSDPAVHRLFTRFATVCVGIVSASRTSGTEKRSMTYQAPVDDIVFALKTAAGIDELMARGLYPGLDRTRSLRSLKRPVSSAPRS